MIIRSLSAVALALLALSACETLENACDEYAAYMCDCHDLTQAQCDELYAIANTADIEILDTCDFDLAQQKAEDEANGFICDTF